MKKIGKYETPEIEITKFDVEKAIMTAIGGGETDKDGDLVETSGEWVSEPDIPEPTFFM